jgi:hypothetical protein
MTKTRQHLCAGCDEPITDEFIPYDLPEIMTFSQVEFYIFGKSQFCRQCIAAIEKTDEFEEFEEFR